MQSLCNLYDTFSSWYDAIRQCSFSCTIDNEYSGVFIIMVAPERTCDILQNNSLHKFINGAQ